jgi:LysR family hydrogen peroxide-inducible transcriptional activator
MPSFQQLRYLVAVADTLNFSRAAELCHVTQPTLSMQLRELELKLDAHLVERTRSRVLLTPLGENVVRRARSVLAEIDDIKDAARQEDPASLKGLLQMGVVQSVGAYVLSVAMPKLREDFPALRVIVREDRIEFLPKKLADGAHDVLLLPEPVEDPDFTCAKLIREPLHLVLPSDHPLAGKQNIEPEDLAGETILSMEQGHRIHDQIAALCTEVGAAHAKDYAGNTLDTLRLMVTCGMGLTLLPALYVRSDVMRETLVTARPLSNRAPFRELHLVWRTSSPRGKAYRRLADVMRASLSPWDCSPSAEQAEMRD